MKRKKNIVIIADSLGMPRKKILLYDDTYSSLIEKTLPEWDLFCRCRRRNDSKLGLESFEKDILGFKPDVIVTQIGIVDCAPRTLKKKERKILQDMLKILPGFISPFIWDFFRRERKQITKRRRIVYVEKNQYVENMEKIIKKTREVGAIPIIIGICQTHQVNKDKSYNLEKNIEDYNFELKKTAKKQGADFIDVNSKGTSILLPDGIHLNVKGHRYVANQIVEIIKRKHA